MSQPRAHISYGQNGALAVLPAVNVHKITSDYTKVNNELVARFNVYGYEQTEYAQLKHKVTAWAAVPYGVSAQSCQWTPKRLGRTFNNEITLNGMMLNGEQCVDEVFGSDFESMLTPARDTFNDLGMGIMFDFAEQVAMNFSDDVIGAGTAGGLITDWSGSIPNASLPTASFTNMQTASALYTGWMKQASTAAGVAGFEHMNLELLNTSTDLLNDGRSIDPQKAVEALIALRTNAPGPLRQSLLSVRKLRDGSPLNSVYIVSFSYLEALNIWLDSQAGTTNENGLAVTRTIENGMPVIRCYGTPVIHDAKMEHYTQYLSNTFIHAACLTTSKNINYVMGLKGTFNPTEGDISGALDINIPRNIGTFTGKQMFMSSDAKIGAGIANADLFAGTIQVVVNS